MIAVEQLMIRAGSFRLEQVSFQVAAGQYAVLMGKTGQGKSTLLEAICGLRRVTDGQIYLLGRDVTRLDPAERAVAYVPQDLALFDSMTVREHLAFALRVRGWGRQQIADRVESLASRLGLEHLLHRRPAGLSGGESQRVALGRALAFRPRILLLDEPLRALDAETRSEICGLLRSIQRETGMTTLHVTHSRGEAGRLADRLLVLADGRVRDEPLEALRRSGDPKTTCRTS